MKRTLVTVIKNNHAGKEVWRYEGEEVERGEAFIVLEARFNRDNRDDGYFVWQRGDRFVEYFYTDRWYNIFEIHDVNDDHVRGWYCNFTRPASIVDNLVQSDDLELDLFVYPDGRTLVMDEADFEALLIDASEKALVRSALDALMEHIRQAGSPFDALRAARTAKSDTQEDAPK